MEDDKIQLYKFAANATGLADGGGVVALSTRNYRSNIQKVCLRGNIPPLLASPLLAAAIIFFWSLMIARISVN